MVADVCAIVVTRGDVNLDEVLAPYEDAGVEVFVWDNLARPDLQVYGRYAAISYVDAPVIMVQDDDCVLPATSIWALLEAYEPGHVTCNMPTVFREHYLDSALVGFGAVFDRGLPEKAFNRFRRRYGDSVQTGFYRECDTVFTMLTPLILVDVDKRDLDRAHDGHTLWKQDNHFQQREMMRALARKVRENR